MSAWKKPSRSAWRRKVWITRAPERRQVEALGRERRAIGAAACRRSIRASARPRGALPVDRRHAEIRIVLGVLRHLRERGGFEPQIHFDRRPSAPACRPPRSAQPPRFGRKALGRARREEERVEIARKRRSMPGRSTFTATGSRPSASSLGAVHLRDRGGGDRRAERREGARAAACRARPRPRPRPRPAETAPSCPAGFRDRARAPTPTTSGRVARNWPSLT